MQIPSLSGLFEANFFANREKVEKHGRAPASGGNREDTVSISAEALSLARDMLAARASAGASEHAASEDSQKDEKEGNAAVSHKESGIIIDGIRATEKELYAQIQKTQEDVDRLTSELEQIMSSEGSVDEKLRLSEPTQKELKDKLETLSSLKSMAEAAKMNKAEAGADKNPLAAG